MPKTILVLAANPNNTDRIRLDEEVREIDEGLRRARRRDQFKIEQKWAVRPNDLRRAMLDYEPEIVHFSGHGAGEQGIVLEDSQGAAKPVSGDALHGLFKQFSNVECVLLNACYSQVQANAIAKSVQYVVGMSQAIGDRAAITFATGFYDALGAGRSIEASFEFARNALQLESIPEDLTPVLKLGTVRSKADFLPDSRASFKDVLTPKPARKTVRGIDLKTVWNNYALMAIDWQANGIRSSDEEEEYYGDGRLTRQSLEKYIERLEKERANEEGQGLWRRNASFDRVKKIDEQLAEARSLLHDLEEANADAVDHLPTAMEDLPDYLRRLAVEMLMLDDKQADLEITQFIVDTARSRYHRLPERTATQKKHKADALADIQDLAKRLGFY